MAQIMYAFSFLIANSLRSVIFIKVYESCWWWWFRCAFVLLKMIFLLITHVTVWIICSLFTYTNFKSYIKTLASNVHKYSINKLYTEMATYKYIYSYVHIPYWKLQTFSFTDIWFKSIAFPSLVVFRTVFV